jgi:hypothetical protein
MMAKRKQARPASGTNRFKASFLLSESAFFDETSYFSNDLTMVKETNAAAPVRTTKITKSVILPLKSACGVKVPNL